MRLTLSLFFVFFLLVSCSKKKQESSLVIINANLLALGNSSGGLMMWGVSSSSNESFALSFSKEEETKSISLANGTWQFAGVSWAGSNSLEGKVKCGLSSMTLSGGIINMTLPMSEKNCDATLFSDSSFMNGLTFAALKVITCNETTARADITGNSCDSYLGKAKSFKLVLPEYLPDLSRSSSTGLTSSCHNIDDTDSTELTSLMVPVGATSFNVVPGLFAVMIRLYSGINCNASLFYAAADYPEGLFALNENPSFPNAGVSLIRSVNSAISGTNVNYLFIKDAEIPPGQPAKISFINNLYVAPDTCTSVFVVRLEDASSQEVPSGIARTVTLDYTAAVMDLSFYSDPSCTNGISELNYGAATIYQSFYLKKTTVGRTTIYAASSGLLNANAPFAVVDPGTVVKLEVRGVGGDPATPSGTADTCISAYSVRSLDLNNAVAYVTGPTTVNLSYSGTQDGAFYFDPRCATTSITTTVTIPIGTSLSANVYFKKTTAEITIVSATSSGLGTGAFSINITAGPP